MIKKRVFKDNNYSALWYDGKTMRIAIDPQKPITELEYPEFLDVKITGFCEGKCPWCLTGDAAISTIEGDKQIKDIKKGDTVFNMNLKKHDLSTGNVDQLHKRHYDGNLIEIELENGSILSITPNHRVYTYNRGYINASEISEKDDILCLT